MAMSSSCHGLPSMAVPRFSSRGKRKVVVALRLSAAVHSSTRLAPQEPSRRCLRIGVVCYRDGSGEVICEGFDEGPRLGMRLPENPVLCRPMGIRVTDFIELSTLPVLEDEDALK